VQFTPAKKQGDASYFFFARKDDKGNLLLNPQTKELTLRFGGDFFAPTNPYAGLVPRTFEFKVSKMMLNGNVEF